MNSSKKFWVIQNHCRLYWAQEEESFRFRQLLQMSLKILLKIHIVHHVSTAPCQSPYIWNTYSACGYAISNTKMTLILRHRTSLQKLQLNKILKILQNEYFHYCNYESNLMSLKDLKVWRQLLLKTGDDDSHLETS